MRPLALGLVLASLTTLTSACGGQSGDAAAPAPAAAASTPAAASSPAAAPTSAGATASSTAGAPSSPGPGTTAGSALQTALTAAVGTADDPDAFVITLTDPAGTQVSTLPAGSYRITVKDPSDIHNFHLTGAGVDEQTTVPEVTETTWDVTLVAGGYTFICDPHPRMVGTFTVT